MEIFVCVLKDYRRVHDVLLGLLDLGVSGGTVIDARGMGQILGGEIPIFAGSRGLFPGSGSDSYLVFSVAPSDKVADCMALVERVAGPLSEPGCGVAFCVPVSKTLGILPPSE